jgi:hypothetical protein
MEGCYEEELKQKNSSTEGTNIFGRSVENSKTYLW